MICKLPQQSNIKMEDWSAKNNTWITFLSPWAIFGNRSEIIFRGVGQQHFPVCSQKDRGLTLPYMKYFEILTHHYVWSNKELEEFPASFASSKTSYFIRLFGILTFDVGIPSGNIMLLTWTTDRTLVGTHIFEALQKRSSGVLSGVKTPSFNLVIHSCYHFKQYFPHTITHTHTHI